MIYQKVASNQGQQMGAGRGALMAAGRTQPQSAVNYRGNATGMKPGAGIRAAGFGGGFVPGRAPMAAPAAGQSPAQVADQRFNRYQAPPQHPQPGTPQVQRDYGTPEARPRGGLGAGGLAPAQAQAHGGGTMGMMVKPGASLMDAMRSGQASRAAPVQAAGGRPQVLGGGGAGMSAYASGPAADQSLMKAQGFMGNTGDTSGLPFMDAARDFGQAIAGAPGVGPARDADAAVNNTQSQATTYAGNTMRPLLGDVAGEELVGRVMGEGGNPSANFMVDQIGELLSGMSNRMSAEDMANIEKFFGESGGAYRDMMGAARGIMDPGARNAWEDAARADLGATVNADKLANLRMAQAAQGRGGFGSSNAMTGIYGNAANALATGERGIAQDRFSRDLAATQAGIAGLGAGGSALEKLLESGFTSNKEVLSLLLTGMEKGNDVVGQLADLLGGKFTV